MPRVSPAVILAAALASASPAMANVVVYIGNDPSATGDPLTSFPNATSALESWSAALSGAPVFSGDLGALAVQSYPSGTSLAFNPGLSAIVTANTLSVRDVPGANGQYATLGATDNYFESYIGGAQFQFNEQVSGFSVFVTDLGDVSSETVTMTLLNDGNQVASYQVTCGGSEETNCVPVGTGNGESGSVSFIGVTDTAGTFDTVVFTSTDSADAVGYDNIEVSAPEPASLAVLGSGLLALAVLRRKRLG